MPTYAKSRYRVTQWPGVRVPIPQAERFPAKIRRDGMIVLSVAGVRIGEGAPPELDLGIDLPDELYLRDFMRLDTLSPQAIAEFVGRWGALETPWAEIIPLEWVPGTAMLEDHRHLDALIEAQFEEIKHIRNAERERPDPYHADNFLPDSFMLKTGLLRDAIRLHLYAREAIGENTVEKEWESAWAYKFKSIDLAMREFFVPIVRRALAPFSVTVYVAGTNPFARKDRPYSTYNLLALQLANDVSQNSEYRVCQHSPCGRVFVRQSGRSRYGQSRTSGVKYCSAQCASNAASAKYRRKNAGA